MSKRIVVCLDGTWNRHDQPAPTNVAKLARAVVPLAPDGTHQVVFYDEGVGTGNWLDQLVGGAFGEGLEKNIGDAYHFLVQNYLPGDNLYIFGFSRGAYTTRSLGGLIRKCGILRKAAAGQIREAYQLYRRRDVDADHEVSKEFRRTYAHEDETETQCLGVWDTVGSRGIPGGIFGLWRDDKYGFHDAELSRLVRHGYHALSIDERRTPFRPTLWERIKGPPVEKPGQRIEQTWFVGAHTDIGGGNSDSRLSDIALRWMAERAANCGLVVNEAQLPEVKPENSRGTIHNRVPFFYKVMGSYKRPIGTVGIYESLHASVLERWNVDEKYRPQNLKRYLGEE